MATTQKQISIKGVEGVQDQAPTNNDFIIVWSALRFPLTLTFPASRFRHSKEPGARHETLTYTLKPGANRVPKNIWDHNKNKPTIDKRIEARDLVVSNAAPKKDSDLALKLEAIEVGEPPAKAASIRALCPAACGVTVKSAMKESGAAPQVFDMDDDNSPITLES